MGEEAGLRMPIRLSPGLEERQALTKSPGKVHTSASSRHVCDRSSRIQEVQGQTWMEVWKKHQNAEKRCLPNLATWWTGLLPSVSSKDNRKRDLNWNQKDKKRCRL